jgi:hypothetical protein
MEIILKNICPVDILTENIFYLMFFNKHADVPPFPHLHIQVPDKIIVF